MASTDKLLDELVRIKAIELKNMLGNQNDTILEMSKGGFAPTRIASLLGTTPGTVNTALQRAKKPSITKKKTAVKGKFDE